MKAIAARKPLAEQLAPYAARMRRSHSVVRPISQSVLQIDKSEDRDVFSAALKIILPWVNDRAGRPLPQEAWDGLSFELEEVGAQRTSAVAIDEPRYWAARLDDSDNDVPQRSWVNEVSIAQRGDTEVLVGARLFCVTRGEDPPFQPSLQRFIRTIVESVPGCRVEGRPIDIDPWVVADEDDVSDLVELLSATSRRLDLIVCSLPEGSEDPIDSSLDAASLHKRTLGAAHIAVLTSRASLALTDAVGKEFSVFRGAVRTYRPSFNLSEDEPYRHPLIMAERVATFQPDGAIGFSNFLIDQSLVRGAIGSDADRHFPPFSQVKRVASELRLRKVKSAGSSDADLLAIAEQEIAQLREASKNDKDVYEGLVARYEMDAQQAREEADQARSTNFHLQARVRVLESQIRDSAIASAEPTLPATLDGFEDWCRAELIGSVEVLNRAFQGVKKSKLEDVTLIYQSMLLLKERYVPMRREGGAALKYDYDGACKALGISEEATFSGERWGEQGDDYRVRYAGQIRLLERHLKKGNSKDQRYCFRLYFFWDDEREQVVVGWLPSHLDTRQT